MSLGISSIASTLIMFMAIGAVGYVIGAISIKGVNLGTVGIFVSALIFGHFGVVMPTEVTNLGLLIFITAVGLNAGSTFIGGLKANGIKYVILCVSTIFIGGLLVMAIAKGFGVNSVLATGMMSGAFTSTPAMTAAKEMMGSSAEAVTFIATGYGLIYPIAALFKVLYAQSIPKILKVDMQKERELVSLSKKNFTVEELARRASLVKMDPQAFFAICIAAILGVLAGAIEFSLPTGTTFALGITGGPLLISLIIGHFGKLGPINMELDKKTADPIKELGLFMLYAGVGTQGGAGAVEIITTYGVSLIFFGFILIFVPLMVGLFVGRKILNIPLLNCLSCNMASMTFTPAMAALAQKSECDDVVAAYASTYPLALVCLVFSSQILLTVLV